jgi:hypothetical protein
MKKKEKMKIIEKGKYEGEENNYIFFLKVRTNAPNSTWSW